MAALGAVLNAHLVVQLGHDVDPNVALNPELRAAVPPEALQTLVTALDGGLGNIYLVMAAMAVGGLMVAFFFPGGSAESHAYRRGIAP